MTTYTVHLPPAGGPGLERARFIPERPSLLALLVPALWLLWHRLWYALVVYLLIAAIAALLARWTDSAPIGLLATLPGLYLFLEGRQLLRGKLERKGWRFAGVVDADDADEADLRYFSAAKEPPEPAAAPAWTPNTATATAPETQKPPLDDKAPSIGIFGQ